MARLINFMSMQEEKGKIKNLTPGTKPKKLCFDRTIACIRKMTREISVLCDVDACAFIVTDDGSRVVKWPENRSDVLKIVNKFYKDNENRKEKTNVVGDTQKKNHSSSLDNYLIDGFSRNSLQEVLTMVDGKLDEVVRRIEVVKKKVDVHYPSDKNRGKEKMIIPEVPNIGLGINGEESPTVFNFFDNNKVGFGSSSSMGGGLIVPQAAAEEETGEGFLSLQSFRQTPYVQETKRQKLILFDKDYLSLRPPSNTISPTAADSVTQTRMDSSDDHHRSRINQSSNFACSNNQYFNSTVIHGNNNNKSESDHEQRFIYMQPFHIINQFNRQPAHLGQESDQFLYYWLAGQCYLQLPPTNQFTANNHGLFRGRPPN